MTMAQLYPTFSIQIFITAFKTSSFFSEYLTLMYFFLVDFKDWNGMAFSSFSDSFCNFNMLNRSNRDVKSTCSLALEC